MCCGTPFTAEKISASGINRPALNLLIDATGASGFVFVALLFYVHGKHLS